MPTNLRTIRVADSWEMLHGAIAHASALALKHKYDIAERLVCELAKRLPEGEARSAAHAWLGSLAWLRNRPLEALRVLRLAERDTPTNHVAKLQLSRILATRRGGRREALLKAWEAFKLARTNREKTESLGQLALLQLRVGEEAAAEKSFRKYGHYWRRTPGLMLDIELLRAMRDAGLAIEESSRLARIGLARIRRSKKVVRGPYEEELRSLIDASRLRRR